MSFNLSSRTALITGGTQGVGAAIAIELARAGADVVLHGLDVDEAAVQTLAACREAGAKADIVTGDLAGPTKQCVERLFNDALQTNPAIDLLVNNAGTYIDVPFLELDIDRYERTMRLNVAAGFFLTQAFARHWVAGQMCGRVLFTGSINGQLAEAIHASYDTSKGAVAAMVRSLCVALAPLNIRVNGIAPGLVKTPLTRPALDEDAELESWMRLHTPNGRVPEAEVCGPAAVFLLSDAAEHIHGQMLLVDGGMSVWQQPDLPDHLRHRSR